MHIGTAAVLQRNNWLRVAYDRARLYYEGPRDFVNETHTMRFVTPKPVQRYLSLSPQMLLTRNKLLLSNPHMSICDVSILFTYSLSILCSRLMHMHAPYVTYITLHAVGRFASCM